MGKSDSFPRTDGNTENGWLAKLLLCISLVLSSSPQFTEAQQKHQQLFHGEGSHQCNSHRNDFSTYQHPIRSLYLLRVLIICISKSEQLLQMQPWEKPKGRASLSLVD